MIQCQHVEPGNGRRCQEEAETNCCYCRGHEYQNMWRGEPVIPDPPKAQKETAGKPAFDILFQTPIRDVAAVFTFGAEKYKEPLQWRKSLKGTDAEIHAYVNSLMAAAIRHIEEQFNIESPFPAVDHQSTLPSLAHAVADLMMALDILKRSGK